MEAVAIGLLLLQLAFVQCILWRENIIQQEGMLIMYQAFFRIHQIQVRNIWFFVSSNSLKTRELSFAQFVYFLWVMSLFLNFWIIFFLDMIMIKLTIVFFF